MTLKEKMTEVKPDAVNYCWIGGVYGCPQDYDFLGVKGRCPYKANPLYKGLRKDLCIKCWNRECIEPEVKENDVTR